jgi:hypothetical protein
MNQLPDDAQLREVVQRLKRSDRQHAPKFDDVLSRQARTRSPQGSPALRWAVVCGAAGVLLAALLIFRSQPNDPTGDPEPSIAKDDAPKTPTDRPQSQASIDIDFDHLRASVDEHFNETEIADRQDWSTQTDSLLALNLNLPPTEE